MVPCLAGKGTVVLDVKARKGVDRVVVPLGRALARAHVSPSAVTIAGLAVTIGGAALIATGRLLAGALVAGVGATLDVLDGPLARVTGKTSRRGAFLDTLADRLGEAALWAGLAYFLVDSAVRVTLCLAALVGSLLVPYIRSKAEGWGVEGKGGLMGRAERMLVMLVAVGIEGLGPATILPMLWIMVALTWFTAAQRAYRTWAHLGA